MSHLFQVLAMCPQLRGLWSHAADGVGFQGCGNWDGSRWEASNGYYDACIVHQIDFEDVYHWTDVSVLLVAGSVNCTTSSFKVSISL